MFLSEVRAILHAYPHLRCDLYYADSALHGPFPDATFCPTGGVTAETAPAFLALPNVACVGGSWLTPADAVAAGDWGRIERLARDAAALPRPSRQTQGSE